MYPNFLLHHQGTSGPASEGVADGTPEHPHYRYGGLWKNRGGALVSGKRKVPAPATPLEEPDDEVEMLLAHNPGRPE